ncbi:MAG: FliA/WhiG family RNA polymerase sigma factor [Bryobacteraceae bacterium]
MPAKRVSSAAAVRISVAAATKAVASKGEIDPKRPVHRHANHPKVIEISAAGPECVADLANDFESEPCVAFEAEPITPPSAALRDKVILEHLPLVKAIAVRVHENLPVHVDLDDLVHAGILGLFDAVNKYDPEKQVAFSSYAKHRIKGAILDSLRQLDWASRDLRRRHKQVEAATRDLTAELQRAPTDAEVAQKLGVEESRWRQMMVDLRNVGLISASSRGHEGEDLPPPDFPSSPEFQPDIMCAREQMRFMLSEAMHTLPERYQKVVVLYYKNEMTMKEIGGILGINESRVSQIHKSALEKMAVALEGAGITSSCAFAE